MDSSFSTSPLQVGDRVGSYELAEKLEETASLIIFRGHDSLLDRQVVIKQLLPPPGAEGVSFRERCREQVDQYRQISQQHKRIVNIIEQIDDERGVFVVMEHVPGDSLDHLLAKGKPVHAMSVLRIVRSTALALEMIHQGGLIHGDLRPSNLIVTASGTVQMADFGLARLLTEQEAVSLASVRYMAPELCRSEPGDARSDLYSLGLIAYEMLIGRPAFEQVFKAVLRDTRQQAIRWVKWHTNLRTAVPAAHELNEKVPAILSDLIARLVEKDPVKRIASARQLIDAIERNFQKPDKSAAGTPPKPTNAKAAISGGVGTSGGGDTVTLPRKSRKPMLIAMVLSVLLLAGVTWGSYNYISSRQAAQQLTDTAKASLDDAKKAYKAGQFSQALATYQQVASQFASDTRLGEVAQAGTLLCEARLQMEAGDDLAARDTLTRADATGVFQRDTIRSLMDEVNHRLTLAQAIEQIREQMESHQLDQARRTLREWRTLVIVDREREQLDVLYDELEAKVVLHRVTEILTQVNAQIAASQREAAIETLTQAMARLLHPALRQRLDQLVTEQQIESSLAQGEAAEAQGDWGTAILRYTEAMNLRADESVVNRLAQAKMQAAIAEGRQLFNQGDLSGAASAFTRALGYGDSAEAKGYLVRMEVTDRKQSLVNAGDEAMAAAEYGAAVRQYEAATKLDASDKALRAKWIDAQLRNDVSRGQRFIEQEDYQAARTAFERAQQIDPNAPGAREGLAQLDQLLKYLGYLEAGDAHRQAGKFLDAKRAYRKARDVMDTQKIEQRMDDVEYEQLVTQARRYIDALQWKAAAAKLRSAKNIHDTEVVRQLQNQVEQEQSDAKP